MLSKVQLPDWISFVKLTAEQHFNCFLLQTVTTDNMSLVTTDTLLYLNSMVFTPTHERYIGVEKGKVKKEIISIYTLFLEIYFHIPFQLETQIHSTFYRVLYYPSCNSSNIFTFANFVAKVMY